MKKLWVLLFALLLIGCSNESSETLDNENNNTIKFQEEVVPQEESGPYVFESKNTLSVTVVGVINGETFSITVNGKEEKDSPSPCGHTRNSSSIQTSGTV